MAGYMRPRSLAEMSKSLLCLLFWYASAVIADQESIKREEAPSIEMLEYLGTWGAAEDSLVDPVQLLELIESRLAEAPEEVKDAH